MSRPHSRLAVLALTAALTASGIGAAAVSPASSTPRPASDSHDHRDVGEMVDPYATAGPAGTDGARLTTTSAARTVSVSPSEGPDFEIPFRCGEAWVGSTRSTHSPSAWSIDFNRSDDTGRPVLASARGEIYRVAWASGYGNYVIVDHGRGYSTLYAHLQSTNAVVGQVVDQGATIGFLGSTGRVTGPHLHFEMRLNGNYFAPYFHRKRFAYNTSVSSLNCADLPIAGDWDGNGVDDIGVFRQARTTGIARQFAGGTTSIVRYGLAGDTPFVGDWNGDRTDQLGVRRPKSTNFLLRGDGGTTSTANMGGAARDYPLAGHWVAAPKPGIGLYSFARREFTVRLPDLSKRTVAFGASGTQPVVGDWDGDGVSDFGSFDPVTGYWKLRTSAGVQTIRYGGNWDIPVTGDWNGDGVTELGVWRPASAAFFKRVVSNPSTGRATTTTTKVIYGAPRR